MDRPEITIKVLRDQLEDLEHFVLRLSARCAELQAENERLKATMPLAIEGKNREDDDAG
jgi:uncharacterized small protein (DUF1192 family)